MKATTPLTSRTSQLLSVRRKFNPVAEIKAWCLERADEWFEQNQPDHACDFLRHALDLDPSDTQVWIALGSLYFSTGKLDRALKAFTKAGELDSSNATITLHLALTHQQMGNAADAESCFRQSLAQNPANVVAAKLFSGFLMAHNRLNEARELLEHALAIELDDTESLLRLGVCCYQLNDLSAARACFSHLLKLDPKNQVARENLTVIDANKDRVTADKTQGRPA
jgi:Tfp pilus assembly protein PilF